MLMSVHAATVSSSTASKGTEREAFVRDFLANVLPSIYRFGTGDITDKNGERSGQVDVVVEYPHSPTLPLALGSSSTRLYLAEAAAAVIEIKSDISSQWDQVRQTATQLAKVKRTLNNWMIREGQPLGEQIPLFVVGYKGWTSMASLAAKLKDEQGLGIWGILVVEHGLFMTAGGLASEGAWALWGMITSLNHITTNLMSASSSPHEYAGDQFKYLKPPSASTD